MVEQLNKRRIRTNAEVIAWKPNYREAIAVTKPYKGNRTNSKPFHFDNLSMHIYHNYDCKIAIGIEADDLISVDSNSINTDSSLGVRPIICSRDKDLKITPGLHYGWACGRAPSFPVREISKFGFLEEPIKGKLLGGGLMFFFAQVLMGDSTDNVPGLPKYGPVTAYTLLKDCTTEQELYEVVRAEYLDKCKMSEAYLTEQMNLLWIAQELDSSGGPVLYQIPKGS